MGAAVLARGDGMSGPIQKWRSLISEDARLRFKSEADAAFDALSDIAIGLVITMDLLLIAWRLS
ncbi:MAG: hypothetical protein KUG65_05975 [Sphingomonadaceae bacterium]|nr:hypothetical protein [Sphingomonadaceae bacterium]